jgi:hypothetical protein
MEKMESQSPELATFTDVTFTREMKIYGLLVGLFSTFFIIGRRDVAAMIAVLMNRVDIACLCFNIQSRRKVERVLFRFCVGDGCEKDATFNPEGVEALMSLLDTQIWKGKEESKVIEGELLSKIVEVFCTFVDENV